MKVSVIGGGLFGCWIAKRLADQPFVSCVVIHERGSELMMNASINNQHRFHLGYHYPRSQETVKQILSSSASFDSSFGQCSFLPKENAYFVASKNSMINTHEFENAFKDHDIVRIDIEPYSKILKIDKIESGFLVREKVINNSGLRNQILDELRKSNKIKVEYGIEVKDVESLCSDIIVNCSYVDIGITSNIKVKYELCMLALIKNPFIEQKAFTIVDGKFPSLYPTENVNICTLSHVEKTPIFKTDSLIDLKKFKDSLSHAELEKSLKNICFAASDFFDIDFQVVGKYLTYKVKLAEDLNDKRTSEVMYDGNIISVLQGKITTICSVAEEIVCYAKDYIDR